MQYQGFALMATLLLIELAIGITPASAVTRSVTTFGAVPNDAVDDRAAINNAISASSSGDTVSFPTGTYRLSGSVTGKTGVRLEGVSGSVLLYVGSASDVIVALYSVSNVTVTGLILDGNNSAAVSQGIGAGNSSGLTLQNLTIRNLGNSGDSWTHGIIFDPAVTDSTISNNTITKIAPTSVWGAGIRMGHGSSRNKVENNTISNTGRGGILCNDSSTDIIIRNNTVTGSGGEGLGIELWSGCHRGLVEDNHIDHWLSLDTSDYCGIRRNTVSDKSGIYKLAGLEAISQNCVFADNLVDGGAQIGISLSNWYPKEYVLWTRNTIKGCGTWGAQLQGDSGGIAYQYFYQNKFMNTVNAYPPALYSNQGHGFRFNANCKYVTLDSNEITNNAGDGIGPIEPNLNQMSFVNNIITGNGNGSVWDGFGGDMEWSGNTVSGNRWNNQLASRGFANRKPVAAFTCSSVAQPGQVLTFTNTSTDPDGSIGHVLWDFGDGLPSTDRNPTHAYANTGTYIVTLVVWDNLGRGMLTTKSITIQSLPALQVTPTNGYAFSGIWGGPFLPASKAFTLTNTGLQTMNWQASKNQPWLNLSSTGGTLAVGGNTSVVVSIPANDFSPAAGPYSAAVQFTNTTSGIGNTSRSVSLTVLPLPVGVTNKAVLNQIMTTAALNYSFVLHGVVSERTTSGFKIDDGSGVIVSVDAANNTVANGNHVSVKGTLNSVTKVLKSQLITVY